MSDFITLMKKHRKDRGLTQAELASQCGLKRATVAHIERRYQRLYFEHAQKIASVLSIPSVEIASLFEQDELLPEWKAKSDKEK